MRITLHTALAAAALISLSACGGGSGEAQNSAATAHEERADTLRDAADQSTPEAAEKLENMAAQHGQAADQAGQAPAGNIANAPMPANMAQPAVPPQR